MSEIKFLFNREISWLHFNMRVLQEAADKSVPLIERLKFLGIYSSNLDEFFRVRVAAVTKLMKVGERSSEESSGLSNKKIMLEIIRIIREQEERFDEIYKNICNDLKKEGIVIIDEKKLNEEQKKYVRSYFREKIRVHLFPIILGNKKKVPPLKDKSIYLAIILSSLRNPGDENIALVEIPTHIENRFLLIPGNRNEKTILFMDDVLRLCAEELFLPAGFKCAEAYAIKFTKNAEIDLDNDISKSFLEILHDSIKKRATGDTVRFIYDSSMPAHVLKKIVKYLCIRKSDIMDAGGKYHNFKDFINFPAGDLSYLAYPGFDQIKIDEFEKGLSIFDVIRKKDILLNYPYNSFQYLVDMLTEASLDPDVVSIKMTLYRVANNSNVINALVNAVRNGKKVSVYIEIQARFDEEANINWAMKLQEAGVNIYQNIPSLKVHCKLCLIKRKEKSGVKLYSAVSTGNFNENTARQYCDHTLITADSRINSEIEKVFEMFTSIFKAKSFKHLLVSPDHLRKRIYRMIDSEIRNAKSGLPAKIILKLNSLTDPETAQKIWFAAGSGVTVVLIVRGSCIIVPDSTEAGKRITAISIVDRFLEHSRIFCFHNRGDVKYYLSSADLMTRNLDRRIEVAVPVYSPELKKHLEEYLSIQISDNLKSRDLSFENLNKVRKTGKRNKVRSQTAFYEYLKGIEQGGK